MSDLVESIFSDMPTVGLKKRTFKRDIDQTDLWQGSIIFWGMKRPIKQSDRARAQMNFF